MFQRSLVLAVLVALTAMGMAAPAQAAKKFTSCEALHEVYPTGVARGAAAARKVVRAGYERPAVRRAVNKKNRKRLDKDKNKVLCEVRAGSAEPVTAELCVLDQQGFIWNPGSEFAPWGVRLSNPSSNANADWIDIDVLLVNQDNVVVGQSSEIVNELPAGQSMWVSGTGYIRETAQASVTSLTVRFAVECDSGAKTTDPVLSGQGSASFFTDDLSKLSAVIENPSGKPIPSVAKIYFVAFDAAGNILGGDAGIAYTDIPAGLSVNKETFSYVVPVERIASVQYSVEPY